MGTKQQLEVDNRTLALTNLDKVLYPAAHFAKAQVIDYYARVAEWILPHLKDRPVTLKRFPDGPGGKVFYEKDAPRFTPDWVAIAPVPRRAGGPKIRYIIINDRPTLVWCANIASLELHPFLHRANALDTPTSLVFDLDPGEGVTLVGCARVAVLLRDILGRAGLKCFVKLSGSKGLQLYAPLNTPVTYADTQPFARSIAELLTREHPDQIVSEMAKNLRRGKGLYRLEPELGLQNHGMRVFAARQKRAPIRIASGHVGRTRRDGAGRTIRIACASSPRRHSSGWRLWAISSRRCSHYNRNCRNQ